MTDLFPDQPLHWLILGLVTVMAFTASCHALLTKDDSRAAFGWIAVCMLFPAGGPMFYVLFGLNRIRTRARILEGERRFHLALDAERTSILEQFTYQAKALPDSVRPLARVAERLSGRLLVSGNQVEPLHDGEETYPAMLAAIASAEHTAFLSTYIFQSDAVGHEFVDALASAHDRGVDVRVVVDGIGELYGLPARISRHLSKRGVSVARFLPPRLWPPMLYLNLRTHRKSLTVDGRVGFVGGINIAERHLRRASSPPLRISDLHFRVHGPVVAQLEHAFVEDWHFCTGVEELPASGYWSRQKALAGDTACRVIVSGPNEQFANIAALITAATSLARSQVTIVTPYFLPSSSMVEALRIAALRGVAVNIVLPGRSNLRFVDWATRQMLRELLEVGARVWYQPPPFAHSKLFLVDDTYALIGSANIDPRSLRLNFELDLEIYGHKPVAALVHHVEGLRALSREVTLAELEARPLLERLRDGVAWLFSPYL